MCLLLQTLCVFLYLVKVSAQALYNQACPILGLNYPIPPQYATLDAIRAAANSLRDNISQASNGSTSYGQLAAGTTAFSVDVYSLNDGNSLFTYHNTPQALASTQTTGVTTVDSNTVFRVGSVSKVYTVYLYLIAAGGDALWNQPITNFVPELAAYVRQNKALIDQDETGYVDWDSITIGALAGQIAGIPRDSAYSTSFEQALQQTFGLSPPMHNASDTCGNNYGVGLPCTRQGFFNGYLPRYPIVAPFSTPVYSNTAYQLLEYALENITGKAMPDLFQEYLVQPLGLNNTYYTVPPTQNTSFIPGNASVSWWDLDLRGDNAAGGYFSTINDMRKIGKSMLNSTYLTPAQTRRWFKPSAFTADPNWSVGAPWEIFRAPGDTVSWYYTKIGNAGAYVAFVAFLPDYNIGMSFLAAGDGAGGAITILSDMAADVFSPALLAASKADTISRYAGTYTDSGTNSTMTLAATTNGTGLNITQWSINGLQATTLLGTLYGVNQTVANLSIILYPSGLTSANGTKTSWRATFQVLPQPLGTGAFSPNCVTWATLDSLTYGGTGIDEFEFTLSNNTAVSIQPRVLGGNFERSQGLSMSRLTRAAR